MKKITTIFIIVICLLSFIGTSCLGEENMSPGKAWNFFTRFDSNDNKVSYLIKASYVKGFRDGAVVSAVISNTSGSNLDRVEDWCIFVSQNNEAIWKVTDDLYKDPANTNIEWLAMCQIACAKLKGNDNIEQALQEAREDSLR
jgi:hypothetical protein